MYYSPSFVLLDLLRITLAFAMYYYITRLEQIKCLKQPSWKPTFIKFYSIVMIILVVLSTLSPTPDTVNIQAVITSITLPLSLTLIYAVYTYVRELEKEFKDCNLSQNIEFVHEFLKLYSLLAVIGIFFILLMGLSTLLSFVKLPKYLSLQKELTNELRKLQVKKGKK